jgi:hypothetical protein
MNNADKAFSPIKFFIKNFIGENALSALFSIAISGISKITRKYCKNNMMPILPPKMQDTIKKKYSFFTI